MFFVLIMIMLNHPNIVNMIEVVDDPNTYHFYMVLEYIEGKWIFEGSGPPGCLGEQVSRSYLYLHSHGTKSKVKGCAWVKRNWFDGLKKLEASITFIGGACSVRFHL
ncbi:unnamed protein product [Lactuca saligna]|uniref:Protein kinase domain-containing protein n=1 Tax=Lactuca saligna TaxID=75948 RepID=A0AA35ZIL2_LACSI|nr:unnamed protein product [Lactuca saligna]